MGAISLTQLQTLWSSSPHFFMHSLSFFFFNCLVLWNIITQISLCNYIIIRIQNDILPSQIRPSPILSLPTTDPFSATIIFPFRTRHINGIRGYHTFGDQLFISQHKTELVVKNPPANAGRCKRHGFDPWVGTIPWMRKWQSTPVFLPGESHGQRSLVGYSPGGHKESDMTEVT